MQHLLFLLLGLLILSSGCVKTTLLPLEELDISKVRQRSGVPIKFTAESGDKIKMGGEVFENGLGTVAESIFEVDLNGVVSRFEAVTGIGDEAGDEGDVEFEIYVDGKKVWTSGVMRGSSENKKVDINLKGAQRMVLYVAEEDNWDKLQVYWANPVFTVRGDKSKIKAYIEEAVILTPPAKPEPKINSVKVFGVRPDSPFLFTIAATGNRPMSFQALNLPKGLSLDSNTGQITGRLHNKGEYVVTLIAENKSGEGRQKLKIVCGDKLALTPPMGWNSYNIWGCSNIDEQKIKDVADAFVNRGLINYGWTYVNIDCGWTGEVNPKTLEIDPNDKFTDMPGLVDYVHSLGLKIGLYSTPWTHGYDGRKGATADSGKREYLNYNKKGGPSMAFGKFHFEEIDAAQYARWGFDYLKYDWTPNDIPHTKRMSDALKAQKRDIVFSLSNEATLALGGEYAKLANCWRTTDDINDTWGSMATIGFNQDKWREFAGPGHWNDADMLVIGQVGWYDEPRPTKLTPNEQYTHISLWSLLASPLLLGCDISNLDDFTYSLITNSEVIEVNQDPMGEQAALIERNGDKEIWAKNMEDGSKVVGLFNRGFFETEVEVSWESIGISGDMIVRDLWRQKDLGKYNGSFKSRVPRHGVVLIRLRES